MLPKHFSTLKKTPYCYQTVFQELEQEEKQDHDQEQGQEHDKGLTTLVGQC